MGFGVLAHLSPLTRLSSVQGLGPSGRWDLKVSAAWGFWALGLWIPATVRTSPSGPKSSLGIGFRV